MKIKSVQIKNLRAIKEETIYFDDYTCFVGAKVIPPIDQRREK